MNFDLLFNNAIKQLRINIINKINSLHFKKKISLAELKKQEKRLNRRSPDQKKIFEEKLKHKYNKFNIQNLQRKLIKVKTKIALNVNFEGNNLIETDFDGFKSDVNDLNTLRYQKEEESSLLKGNGTLIQQSLKSGLSKINLEQSQVESNKKRFYHVDILKIQNQMLDLGIIDKPLEIGQIEIILKNPFVKYSNLIISETMTEKEHEEFKEQFSKDLDLI